MAPIAFTGLFDGAAFGALAAAVMGSVAPIAMSLTAFSGSAQFATVAVLRDNGTLAAALLSAAALNSRYLAMSAAVPGPTRWARARACLFLTDAAWAVSEGSRERLIGAGSLDLLGWTLGTTAGVLFGSSLADPQALGLDAAFPALFLWLLRDHLGPMALLGAAIALALTPLLPAGLPILIAGLVAGTIGARR